jgi:transcriptional regulator with XRE-family HTH domain
MYLNIGENIKRLRKKQDITQERLAEYLNLSHQAVSKWESGEVSPDISLLPKLSNIFGVTIDTLFGIDNRLPTNVIDEISNQVELLSIGNDFKKAEKLLKDGLAQYPTSYELMLQLATVLRNRYKQKDENNISLLQQSIAYCNAVLNECNDDGLRYKARRGLAISYCMCGEQEKAIEMANSIPITEDIMVYILTGDARIKRCQQNILEAIKKLTNAITHLSELNRKKGNYEDALYYLTLSETIFDVAYENKDYLDLASERNLINYHYAKLYATTKQYDKCLEYLKKYALHAKITLELSENQKYTSRVFNKLEFNLEATSYQLAMINQAKLALKDSLFEPLQQMPEFIEIEHTLNN